MKTHTLQNVKNKKSCERKKRDVVKAQAQKKTQKSFTVPRQRIPRSRWPALIRSYDMAFDKIKWAKANDIRIKNPYRLINDWKKKLSKNE